VRALWLILTAGVLGLAIAAFAVVIAETRLEVLLSEGLLSLRPEIVNGLHELGLSDRAILVSDVSFRILAVGTFAATAIIIFVRRSDDWVAVLSSAMLILIGTSWFAPLGSLSALHPEVETYVHIVGVPNGGGVVFGRSLAGLSVLLFLLVFPDGRFVPRWSAAVFGAAAAHVVLWALLPGTVVDVSTWPGLLKVAWIVSFPALGLAAQVYRYAYVSRWLGRQQSKLVLTALGAVAVVLPLLIWVRPELGQGFSDLAVVTPRIEALYQLVLVLILGTALLLLPITIALSALRYRLWDIDVLINRAVVYGALAFVVAGGWFLATWLMTLAFSPALGQLRGSNLAVLLATVTVAVIIRPVRLRFQDAIDRRFFRRKHDAERFLESFASRLRADQNLDTVADDLLDAVEGVLEPARVSLLLQDPGDRLATASERSVDVS
jgi:hypothetical protein